MRRQLMGAAVTVLMLTAVAGCGSASSDAGGASSPSASVSAGGSGDPTVPADPSAPPTITGTSALTIGQVCADIELTTPQTQYGAPATPVQIEQFAAWAVQLLDLAQRGPAAQMGPVHTLAEDAHNATTSTDIFTTAQQMLGAKNVMRSACAKAGHPIYR